MLVLQNFIFTSLKKKKIFFFFILGNFDQENPRNI